MSKYYRVKLKNESPFWATIISKNKKITIYQIHTKEGDIKGKYNPKDKSSTRFQVIASNSLITYEKPARMNNHYCELEIIK